MLDNWIGRTCPLDHFNTIIHVFIFEELSEENSRSPTPYATACAVEAPCTVKRTGSSRMRICPGLTDGEILPPTSFCASARLSSSASEPHTCAAKPCPSAPRVERGPVGPAPAPRWPQGAKAAAGGHRGLQEVTEGATEGATGGYRGLRQATGGGHAIPGMRR